MYYVPGFDFEPERDLATFPVWFLDAVHSVPPWTPMYGWFWINNCRHGLQFGAQTLSVPTTKGWDWRFHRGGGYLAVLAVEEEGEVKARETKFREAIRPFLTNYEGLFSEAEKELLAHYERLKQCDVDQVSNTDLLHHLEDIIGVHRRQWELHFYFMYGVYVSYTLFENICRELLGIDDTNPAFHKLIRGFDNRLFELNRQLWLFARKASDLGLDNLFLRTDAKDIVAGLEDSQAGLDWLKEFRAFLQVNGWQLPRWNEFLNSPSWIEDPTPPLTTIRQYLAQNVEFDLDRRREDLRKEREEAEQGVLAKVPSEQRDWFKALMGMAQKAGSFSEEHNLVFDQYCHALVRRCLVAWGKRLAKAGTIEEPDDVFFLIPEEIRRVGLSPELYNLRAEVAARRAAWEEWNKTPNPRLLMREGYDTQAAMSILVKDYVAWKVSVGTLPVPRPELKADLYGVPGSPGVAEGKAKVILREDQLGEIEPGDILVAEQTTSSWTAAFALVKGVIVDGGGSLSHAAIVGREYNIPVVVNVMEGTKKIKTGQRVRVDGDLGVVYILD